MFFSRSPAGSTAPIYPLKFWLCAVSLLLGASAVRANDHVHQLPHVQTQAHSVHGMVLFSDGQTLFASHLPMLHPPHHIQLVLELKSDDPELQRTLLAAAEHNVLTIAPERFDLYRLQLGHAQPLIGFAAELFDGHFERAGSKRGQTRFSIQAVRFFREIKLPDTSANTAKVAENYVAVACRDGYFLLHLIQRAGDFDQILRIQSTQEPVVNVAVAYGLPAPEFESKGENAIPAPGQIRRQIWWETADLQP